MKRTALPFLFAALALGCDSPHVERLPVQDQGLDDRLTLRGTVCTRPPDADGFPVKVVFIIDESGSMCITDPPDAQSTGLCSNPAAVGADNYCEPDGNAHPGRVCALYKIINSFVDKPNVEVALIPFETKITGEYPTTGFQSVTSGNIGNWVNSVINPLQSALGQGTDYQGAFAEAYTRIALDISATKKAQRPRSRYVVVFLTDGTPFPRCAADDSLPPQDYATPGNPDLIWPDSPGALDPATGANFCNEDALADLLDPTGTNTAPFAAGTDRNQNYQILGLIDRIMNLQQQYNVADIRVHSILLWNEVNIRTLGLTEQQDLFGDMGAVPDPEVAAHDVAKHLLGEIADHGHGTFQEFTTLAQIQLGTLDYTSLASPFVLKNLIVDNMSAHPRAGGDVPDSDGDGLPDDLDNQTSAGTKMYALSQDQSKAVDSDQDGFDDNFEYAHTQQGFDPVKPDERGAVDTADHLATCTDRDTDGDGLSECAEEYLSGPHGECDTTLVDSDTDGVPDGLEVRYGLNPAQAESPLQDSDGDGVPDLQEIRAHTDPHVSDSDLAGQESYRYDIQVASVDGGVTCYDYSVSNIRLVTPQSGDGTEHGFNHLVVYFDEAPQTSAAGDYGLWRMGCAVAQFAPPSVRAPQGPDLELDDQWFLDPTTLTNGTFNLYDTTNCLQATP